MCDPGIERERLPLPSFDYVGAIGVAISITAYRPHATVIFPSPNWDSLGPCVVPDKALKGAFWVAHEVQCGKHSVARQLMSIQVNSC